VHHDSDEGEQLDRLDVGRALRDEGVTAIDGSTDDWWRDCVDRGIAEFARRGVVFQAFDVMDVLGIPEPDHPNRIGGRFHAAARAGLIEPVGFAQSRRPTAKASIVRTWRGAMPCP
jgi:hypothetical protein